MSIPFFTFFFFSAIDFFGGLKYNIIIFSLIIPLCGKTEKNMTEYLKNFFDICEYPEEAKVSLLADYEKLMASEECKAVFDKYIAEYKQNNDTDFGAAYSNAHNTAEVIGVNGYTAELLIFCCFTEHLKELYIEKGYDLEIWRNTCLDLRHKMFECKKMHGVWGSFVSFWYPRFFTLGRFAIGRLQYELVTYYASQDGYHKNGIDVNHGEGKACELHIPSSGKLIEEEVMESLKEAYKFMKKIDRLQDGKLLCVCSSWLLYPEMQKFLRPGCNILKFQDLFEITYSNTDYGFGDCWRLYNCGWDGDASKLPRDTDMQRRYADWLAEGNVAGSGVGVIVFDGEKILR